MRTYVELIGLLAVIVSLVFVAIEIRQSTITTQAQAMLELNASFNETMIAVYENPALAALIVRGVEDGSLSPTENLQFGQWAYSAMNIFESAHVFHAKDLLDPEDYQGWKRATCAYVGLPGVRSLWADGTLKMNRRFTDFVNTECLAEGGDAI